MSKPALAELPHPAHQVNRVAKATRVVEWLARNADVIGTDLSTDTVATWPPQVWTLVNQNMGEDLPMSDGTIAMVIGMLATRGF